MDNDQRDRRDWQEPDTTPEGPDETTADVAETPAAPEEPEERVPPEPTSADVAPTWSPAGDAPPMGSDAGPMAADAEPVPAEAVDAWPTEAPAQEPSPDDAARSSEIEAWPSQDAAETRQWPTEPPEAGSGSADTWPTSAPEPGEQVTPAEAEAVPAYAEPMPADAQPMPADAQPMPAAAEPPADAPSAEVEAYPSAAPAVEEPAQVVAAGPVTAPSEGATGESTQCPRCGTENAPGLAFCRNCGQRLVAAGVAPTIERPGTPEGTMACPRCGTHNRAGVAFCQNCGANLRGTAAGYVPPAVAGAGTAAAAATERRGGAVLGPVVLLIGVVGLVTAYLLPFLYGNGSLFERAFGADGYGVGFWSAYPDVASGLSNQAYFGLAAPAPLLAGLLVILALAGFVRGAPGRLQVGGLVITLLWSVGLIVLFIVVEVLANWGGDLVGLLRALTPAGIIFFLASLIVLIGTLTRFGRA
jgi:hypothetical protein